MTCPKSKTAFYNISLNQGSSYTLPIVLKDGEGQAIDLTGFTAAMQVRIVPEAEDYIDELTTENGRITIEAEAGRLWGTGLSPGSLSVLIPRVGGTLGAARGVQESLGAFPLLGPVPQTRPPGLTATLSFGSLLTPHRLGAVRPRDHGCPLQAPAPAPLGLSIPPPRPPTLRDPPGTGGSVPSPIP